MNKNRPINLNPLSIRLPITALVSITHRLSGLLIFLVIPLMLCTLNSSLASAEGFAEIKAAFSSMGVKAALLVILAGVGFHLLAGVRHLLMDMHIGHSLKGGRAGAIMVILVTIVCVGYISFRLFA